MMAKYESQAVGIKEWNSCTKVTSLTKVSGYRCILEDNLEKVRKQQTAETPQYFGACLQGDLHGNSQCIRMASCEAWWNTSSRREAAVGAAWGPRRPLGWVRSQDSIGSLMIHDMQAQ